MFKHGWKLALLIVFAVLVFLWLVKASLLSTYITKEMGVAVTVRTISIWPKETKIGHFRIANPPGFKTKTAFEVKKTKVQYRFGALTANPAEIDTILLDDVDLNIEIRNITGSDNNWAAIGAHIPEKKRGREVIVHKLILRNMTVHIQGKGAKVLGVNQTQHFAEMEFDEINSAEGFPTKELVSRIFENAGLIKYLENFLNPTQRIKDTLNPFGIFGTQKAPD